MPKPENGKSHPEEVPIQIDRNHFKVTNPVTGKYLYELGNVTADYELYVESRGNSDDTLVENSDKNYRMEPGDKLYTSPKSLNPGLNV